MSKVRYYPKMKNPLVPISDVTGGASPSTEQPAGGPSSGGGGGGGAGGGGGGSGAVDPMDEFTFTIPGQTPPGSVPTSPNQNVQFKSGASARSRRSKRRRPPKTCISAPAAIFIFLFGGIVFLLGVIFTSCYVAQAFPPIEYGAVFVALGAAVFCVGCVFFCWAKRAQTLHYAPTLRATRKGGGGSKGDKGPAPYEAVENVEEGGGEGTTAGGGAGVKRGSRVGFDSTPNSPESKETDDTAIGSPLSEAEKADGAVGGSEGFKRLAATSSSTKGAGREFQHLATLRNGVIQEETEDESMGEQALLSIDEGELKSCR